jgi:hypothetical protein
LEDWLFYFWHFQRFAGLISLIASDNQLAVVDQLIQIGSGIMCAAEKIYAEALNCGFHPWKI